MKNKYMEALDKAYRSTDFHERTLNVIRAEALKKSAKRIRFPRSFIKAVIACFLTLAVAVTGISVYAVAAEAKEYRAALDFFEKNNISMEGLTRDDIKTVYKDITMKTYSYEKTIAILNRISVELYSVELETTDKKKLDELWNSWGYSLQGIFDYNGLHYNNYN